MDQFLSTQSHSINPLHVTFHFIAKYLRNTGQILILELLLLIGRILILEIRKSSRNFLQIYRQLNHLHSNFSSLKVLRDCAHSIEWDPILFFWMHEYSRDVARK